MIYLAPMEGVVDPVFREVFTGVGGIDACVTEFLRITDSVLPDRVFFRHCPELRKGSKTSVGTPVIFQLLGGRPEPMAQNALRATQLGARGIDINFGCPAKTVNRHDGGAALLKDPKRVFEVSKAVRSYVPQSVPVSAKIRLGYEDKIHYLEIAHAAQEANVQHLTVHARTKLEGYRPPAHWEYIAKIQEALQIPVVANGDIWTVEDYHRCKEITGCTSFMLGRGLLADPFLGLKCKGFYNKGSSYREVLLLAEKIIDQSEELYSAAYALARWKQWLRHLSRNFREFEQIFETDKRLKVSDLPQESLRAYYLLQKSRVMEAVSTDAGHCSDQV